jgi:8-oxo-dGTP diphosphatase
MAYLPKTYRVAADAIIVDDPEAPTKVVLIWRKNPPYQDRLALPGGFMEEDENLEQCCVREAEEETSLKVEIARLVGVYSDVDRDPRGRVVTGAYLCQAISGSVTGGDDAADAAWYALEELVGRKFAFDHGKMLEDAGLLPGTW